VTFDIRPCQSKVFKMKFIGGMPDFRTFWATMAKISNQELIPEERWALRQLLTPEFYGSLAKLKWRKG
jgi:hypothetical protein